MIGEKDLEYTVKKNKKNRIALRGTACFFLCIAIARIIYIVTTQNSPSLFLTVILCAGGLGYGSYLLINTLKPQAYDITYQFGDQTLTLKMKNKQKVINYSDITDLGYVLPNPEIDYSIIQLYVGKEQYVLPFMNNSNVGKALYEMIKIKREEAKEHN